jgi:hypothetical protein
MWSVEQLVTRTSKRYARPRMQERMLPRVLQKLLVHHNQLPKLILDAKFTDGLEVAAKSANPQLTTAAA